jgi:hypothetical protein
LDHSAEPVVPNLRCRFDFYRRLIRSRSRLSAHNQSPGIDAAFLKLIFDNFSALNLYSTNWMYSLSANGVNQPLNAKFAESPSRKSRQDRNALPQY